MDLWLYVYGNGEFIYTILNSVNFFMHNAMSFFKVAAVICLLLFAFEVTGVMPTKNYDWMRFVKTYFLISIFVLTPYPGKTNVHDVLTNQDYTFNPSSGRLPIGLIFPIAITSDIMHRLINLYQQNYAIDSNLNYTYSGMNFGANFILGLDSVNSYDDKFNYNLDNYMQNCGFPLLHKVGKLSDLRSSKDIFATLMQNTSGARYVQQVDFGTGQPLVKACDLAIADVNNYYEANKDNILMNNANMMGVDTSTADLKLRFMNAANATSSQLLGIAQGAATTLKQAIAMNMIMASVKNGAQAVGNGSLALSVYDTEQFQQYKKVGELSGSASARTIPVLVASAFALLFFLYPIMIFLAIAKGSYKAIGVFFQIVVAINLIPLLYEILNYISTYYLEKKLGVTITGLGFNYDVSTSLYSFTDNMIVAGNYLATSAPLIAYAIVSGSAMALTSVFGHINDPAKSQAQQVGNEMARGNQALGNVSIDNASFNNMQGNKLDDQFVTSSGVPILKDTNSGGVHTNVGGHDYDENFRDKLLVKPDVKNMMSDSLQNTQSHNHQISGQYAQQFGSLNQRISNLMNDVKNGHGASLTHGNDESYVLKQASEYSSKVQAGLSILGNGGGMSSSERADLSHNQQELNKYADQLSYSSNQAISDTFNSAKSLNNNSSKVVADTFATAEALTNVNSMQSSVSADYSKELAQQLRINGDPRNMTASEQMHFAQEFVKEKINAEYGIKTDLHGVPVNNGVVDAMANKYNDENVNNNGLDNPINTSANDIENAHQKMDKDATVQAKQFKEHPAQVVGEQITQEGKKVYDVYAKPVVDIAENFIDKVTK